jgi:DNA invertase Pin-like site-specific DNA recombinase
LEEIMNLVGYSRVSTADQTAELQEDALAAAGCQRIFTETASGVTTERPELSGALAYLRNGDVLVVWRLDRLGRSLKHLVQVVGELQERGVGFRSLHENIDTTTPTGRLTFHLFAALAEFERDLIRERTLAGLTAARARGRLGGRKPSLTPRKIQVARRMYEAGDSTVAEIAQVLGVSRATIYRHLGSDRSRVTTAGSPG